MKDRLLTLGSVLVKMSLILGVLILCGCETTTPTTTETPDVEVTVEAPDVEVTEEAPDAEVTEEAPDVEVTVEAPDVEVTVEAPDVEVTVEAPDVAVTPEAPDVKVTTAAPGVIRGSGKVIIEERPVSDFNRLSLIGTGDVFITQGEEESLTVEADDNLMPYIKSDVKDGTLTLGFTDEGRNGNVKPSRPIKFNLTVKKILNLEMPGAMDVKASSIDADSLEIVLKGAGDIDITSLTAKEELLIRLSGAGDVNIESVSAEELLVYLSGAGDVKVKSVSVNESVARLSGAGDIDLAGQVVAQSVFLSGAGDYRAPDLQSQTAVVEVSGVGGVIVRVNDTLDVRVSGPGKVEYYWSPSISHDISAMGKLISLDNPSLEFPGATPTERVATAPGVLQGSGNVATEERPVSGFDRVSLGGVGDVFVTQGEGESLTVEADDNLMPYIETEVRNGTLILKFADEVRQKDIRPTKTIKFNVRMKEVAGLEIGGVGDIHASSLDADNLELVIGGVGDINAPSLDAEHLELVIGGVGDIDIDSVTVDDLEVLINGFGDVIINSLTADRLELVINGSADINVKSLNVEKLVTDLNGAGDIALAGQVVEQGVFLAGAGEYWAAELQSQTAVVEAGGAGNVTIWVTDSLDVQIGGPSTVRYYGTPQVTKDISRVGRLVSLGNP